jgi:hypothetical protein
MLSLAFGNYLLNRKSAIVLDQLLRSFFKNQLSDYAQFLSAYIRNDFKDFEFHNSSDSTTWHVGFHPPQNPDTHTRWFDLNDLTPYVFVHAPEGWSDDVSGWYALKPVYVWQYRAFASLVKFELNNSEDTYLDLELSNRKVDFFNLDRIQNKAELDFVIEVYQDEAKAYCTWFGKFLMGEKMICLEESLGTEALNQAIPDRFSIWDYSSFDENSGIAFNKKTIYYTELSDLLQFDTSSDKAIFKRFEGSSTVGFSTFVKPNGAYKIDVPQTVYPYLRLLNKPGSSLG